MESVVAESEHFVSYLALGKVGLVLQPFSLYLLYQKLLLLINSSQSMTVPKR